MEDPAGAAAELGRAALDFSFSASTAGVSVSVKIDNVVLASIVSIGALSLGAYYLANRRPVENAVRNGLERRNEAGVVDPEVRNIEEGSILVELLCKTEHSLIQFVKDFESRNVKRRLEKEFKRIGFSSELLVTMENANEVNKKVEVIRLSQKGSRTEKVEGGSVKPIVKMATGTDEEPMDGERRNILRRCRATLVKDMKPLQVLRHMVDPVLFAREEKNQIKSRVTRQQQCEALLDMLPRKGAKAYEIFKETIAIVHPHLTRTIIAAENKILRSERAKSADLQRRYTHRTGMDTGTKPLAMGRVKFSGRIPAEHLETSDSQIVGSVERNQACLQCTKLAKELTDLKTQIDRLREEVIKYKNAVSRAFLPSEKEFTSPTGVLSFLRRDGSVKLVATRSSEGPGRASDIFYHSNAKESGTAEKMNSWWCVDLSKNYRLVITHYALRHGKKDGKEIIQSWELQGSNDKDTWKNICYTPDPSQFRSPHPYVTGRWSVHGEVGAFRYFRILQTGLNSSNKYGIYLSGIELYGTLAKM